MDFTYQHHRKTAIGTDLKSHMHTRFQTCMLIGADCAGFPNINAQNPVQEKTTQMPNDSYDLLAGGAKYFAFKEVGTTITGTISEEPVARQQTDIKTGELMTWPDGNPKMVLVITLQTDLRDPADPNDDGKRSVWMPNPGGMRSAIIAAIKAVSSKGLDVGGKLTISFTGYGEKTNPAFDPPKVYQASYEKPNASASLLGTGDQSHGRPQPAVGQGPVPANTMPPINPQASGIPANLPPGMTPEVWRTLSPEAQAALANMAPAK